MIEVKGPYGDWEPATEVFSLWILKFFHFPSSHFYRQVPASETKATVNGLKEGKEYKFRVKAVNKGGASSPSDPSNAIIAKARNGEAIYLYLFL